VILNPQIEDIIFTPLMGFDLETTGLDAWLSEIGLIALANENGDKYVLEAAKYPKEDLAWLCERLKGCKCIGQNIKFDTNFVWYHYGVLLTNIHCSMVTAQIIENGYQRERDFDLAAILKRYLNVDHQFAEDKKKLQKSFVNPLIRRNLLSLPALRDKQIRYAAEDTHHLIQLYHKQLELIAKYNLDRIYKLEHLLLPVLTKIEVRGCLIDAPKWQAFVKDHWEPKLNAVRKQIDDYLGFERKVQSYTIFNLFENPSQEVVESEDAYNYASSTQLFEIFRKAGEPVPTKKDGTESVDEDTLSTYLTENPDTKLAPLIDLLLTYRQYAKLISTYGSTFLAKLDAGSHIHTQYTQTTTETARLSSKSPNLQNLPKPDKEDSSTDIRQCFIAHPGYKLITCDMDAAEVRIAADFSGDELLINSLESGADMHSKIASVTYSIIFKQHLTISKSKEPFTADGKTYIPQELRDHHKTGLFAKFYKAGAARMYSVFAEYINAHHTASRRKSIAQEISDAIDKELPQLSKYLSRLIQEAKKNGFLIANKLGRIRHFDSDVYGQAANLPIQTTNADAIKIAMIKVDEYLQTIGGYIVLSVHDELCIEVPEALAEEAAKELRKSMSEALGWFLTRIKGDTSVKISTHWQK